VVDCTNYAFAVGAILDYGRDRETRSQDNVKGRVFEIVGGGWSGVVGESPWWSANTRSSRTVVDDGRAMSVASGLRRTRALLRGRSGASLKNH